MYQRGFSLGSSVLKKESVHKIVPSEEESIFNIDISGDIQPKQKMKDLRLKN
jgi:hypothetical protein